MKTFINNYRSATVQLAFFCFFMPKVVTASDGPLISMGNTDFVVLLAFLAFVALLIYLKVPTTISSLLDKRAAAIREEIDSANQILADSKKLLADLEREHKNNIQKAERIILDAEEEAKKLIANAKKDIKLAIGRKIQVAEEQIKASEKAVITRVKNRSVELSVKLAEEKLNKSNNSANINLLINKSIESLKNSLN